jgi:glycosyltransferase involved in cell wall biosynthesis
MGGAQRVHLEILNSIKDKYKQVYFTRYSPNEVVKEEFYSIPNSRSKDIHFWCDNLLFRLFTVHFYAFYINGHNEGHVFSSNSTFFYDVLPFIKKSIIKTELLHNFTYGKKGMEFFGLSNYKYLDNRMTIDGATRENIINQYRLYHVPEHYDRRVHTIEHGVFIPGPPKKQYELPLKVIYAGRGGPQKRIYLLDKIAQQCIERGLPLEFHFAGNMMSELSDFVKERSVIHGEVSKQEDMFSIYSQCHVLLMTSAFEGFPMVVKESMAWGCIPVVTALEGNMTHLKDRQNSLLIFDPENEDAVVKSGIANLELLCGDLGLTRSLSERAYTYACEHFDRENFLKAYRDFFLS